MSNTDPPCTLPGGVDAAALSPLAADGSALSAALAAERRVKLALWASGESVWEWHANSGLVVVDRNEINVLVMPMVGGSLTLKQFFDHAHVDDAPQLRLAWQLHLRGAHPDVDLRFRVMGPTGSQRWLRVRGRALARNAQGVAEHVLGTLKDVTAQRDSEDSLRLMAHAFSSTRDAMAVVDSAWTVLEINEALGRLTGRDSGLAPGSDLRQWVRAGDCPLDQVLADGLWRGGCELQTSQGGVPLMRWTTEAFGSVSPVEFIPLAEKVGLIQLMGRHAAHAAAQLAASCLELGYSLPVAVNLSPRQLQQPGLDSLLLHACKRHGIEPGMMELELTESALVHNMDVVTPMLHRLRGHGFSLALDDFGTGYSSLSYLRHLPFDKVKNDRSFVSDIDRDPAAARLLESIVSLCKVLGMRTVAEGVETPQQLAALTAMGVDEFQGYHFARPMPVDEWLELLRLSRGQPPVLPLSAPTHLAPVPPVPTVAAIVSGAAGGV